MPPKLPKQSSSSQRLKLSKPSNAEGDVNLYATALIHSLHVHEDAMDAISTAENMKRGHATVSNESAALPF